MEYVVRRNITYRNDRTGKSIKLPALFTESGIIISHVRFLATKLGKSQSWKDKSAFSIKLLIEYINTNKNTFNKTTNLLQSFTDCLNIGTIDYQQMYDPSGLYWHKRAIKDANNILFHITLYTDFLTGQKGYDDNRVNPFRTATCAEQRLNWCAYYNKQANVFLNHLSPISDAKTLMTKQRIVAGLLAPKVENEDIKRFPEERFFDLLYTGFVRAYSNINTPEYKRFDYKSQAITILLNNGGIRKSEFCHIFSSDITLNPNTDGALVRIYHPSEGESPDTQYRNRETYLKIKYNLLPRNKYRLSERLHAGWKGSLLTSSKNYFEVIFSPQSAAKDFLETYKKYIKYQRVSPAESYPHPFAFTNQKGEPETIKNFQRLHKGAVERIGLISSKNQGTTEHGHRHSYGYRLAKFGFSQAEIKLCMHHKSPNSCLVYIEPSTTEIIHKMQEAGLSK